MKYSISIEELINRPIIRNDKPEEFLNKMTDEEYEHIEGIYVNQTTNGGYTGDEFAGTCSIKIGENEYFQFAYSM